MKERRTYERARAAVSLRYRPDHDSAPRITAKGQGEMAERIIALAREHGIPIKEDPDLVQILSQIDLQEEIPPAVYQVVAELLAFIYRVNRTYPVFEGETR